MPIQFPALYAAVYGSMRQHLVQVESRQSTHKRVVYRAAEATFRGRSGADALRTPFRSSTNDANRWTGPRPPGAVTPKPAAGGVYTSLGMNDALLGEVSFYAFNTTIDEDVQRQLDGKPTVLTSGTFSTALARKVIFEYAFAPTLRIADLSLTSRGGLGLLRTLDADVDVRDALRRHGYRSTSDAYLASGDHSVPRAMSQAVRDFLPGFSAIWVTSARADAARSLRDEEGDNIIFFGADGVPLVTLTPAREIAFTAGPRGVGHVVTAL